MSGALCTENDCCYTGQPAPKGCACYVEGVVPQWARKRANELANEHGHVPSIPCGAVDAFAAYIAAHEEPPVDPLIAEAMEFTQGRGWNGDTPDKPMVRFALAAIKHGIDLAYRLPEGEG